MVNTKSIFEILESNSEGDVNTHDLFTHLLTQKTRRLKIPLNGAFELTSRCTLNCKMCYVHDLNNYEEDAISGERWIEFAQSAYNLGMLNVTLTGGEAMLHKDFCSIYGDIHKLGIRVTIMTNGTAFTDQIYDMLNELPPKTICITVYGFSESTYRKACNNAQAFNKVIDCIERCVSLNLPIQLQSTITKDNKDDILSIAEYARKMNLPYTYNYTLTASSIISQNEIEKISLGNNEGQALYALLNGGEKRVSSQRTNNNEFCLDHGGMQCGAGNNTFYITSKGYMQPCATMNCISYDLNKSSVKNAWNDLCKWASTVKQLNECYTCKYFRKCKHCIALHYNDTHEFGKPSPRLCYKFQHGITD